MRPPATGHRLNCGAAAQRQLTEIHVDLLAQGRRAGFAQRPRGKPAGKVDRSPERGNPVIEGGDIFLVGQVADDDELHLRALAQPKALRLGLVEARHMADGAGFDQAFDQRGAERTGAAGDDDVTIMKIHGGFPIDQG